MSWLVCLDCLYLVNRTPSLPLSSSTCTDNDTHHYTTRWGKWEKIPEQNCNFLRMQLVTVIYMHFSHLFSSSFGEPTKGVGEGKPIGWEGNLKKINLELSYWCNWCQCNGVFYDILLFEWPSWSGYLDHHNKWSHPLF